MVKGQTSTGENIKCIIHVLSGIQIQNGSLIIRRGAESKNPNIPRWCIETSNT